MDGGAAQTPGTLGGLIAVRLGGGGSRVSCSYHTPGLTSGLVVSGLALATLLAVAIGGALRTRTRRYLYWKALMMKLSVVVPCYNEEAVIDQFDAKTRSVLDTLAIEYEICYVDDGSRDKTLMHLRAIWPKSTPTPPATSPSAATSARRPACSPGCARPPATPW